MFTLHARISKRPNVCHGKPVVSGTRVLVCNILGALASDESIKDILEDYPTIAEEDILAIVELNSKCKIF